MYAQFQRFNIKKYVYFVLDFIKLKTKNYVYCL